MPGIKRKRTRSHGPRRVRARFRVHIRRRHRGRKSTKKGVNLPATTFQSDHRVDYVRRPASKRVKRRARAFAQRVQRVIGLDIPTQVYNFNFSHAYTTPQGQQAYLAIPFYAGFDSIYTVETTSTGQPSIVHVSDPTNLTPMAPLAGSYSEEVNPTEWNHMFKIFQNVFNPSQLEVQPQGLTSQYLNRILFSNAILNLEITNFSSQGATASGYAYIDVYHLWARKDSIRPPEALFVEGIIQNQPGSTGIGTVISTPNTPYVTPFDSPTLCKHWLIKNKRSFTLAPGQNIRLQLRDRKEYHVSYDDFIGQYIPGPKNGIAGYYSESPYTYSSMKKYSECYFIVWKGAPSIYMSGSSSQVATCNFAYDIQYRYKVVNTPAIIGATYTNSNTL